MSAAIDPWLERWRLRPEGDLIVTHSSLLLPVRHGTAAAMLKVARTEEEARGNRLMVWWAGDGAAAVFASEDQAILMERASGPRSLAAMARGGRDDQATIMICTVAERLHRRGAQPGGLVGLEAWFAALPPAARRHGGWLAAAWATARHLLESPREAVVLHGDLHHDNVLDFDGTWRAIDPKGLFGERGFDFANLLRNPEAAIALAPGRLSRQAGVIAERTGLDRRRLLEWTLAFCGLSAAWLLAEGETPTLDAEIARIVADELGAG